VFLSGSVLIRKGVVSCGFWSWSVVVQAIESSNNLYYGPSDLTAFCADEGGGTALIVLPTHAIWAKVYGIPANTNDPTWKPNPKPPDGHECWTGEVAHAMPSQGILVCDRTSYDFQDKHSDEKPNPVLKFGYTRFAEWIYNRGEQPGVSQGSISIAPIAGTTKSTWDVQVYGSGRRGPGWLGFQGMYEHDRKPTDDLNSLTAALTYDIRIKNTNEESHTLLPFWRDWGAPKAPGNDCVNAQGECSPPIAGIRPMELSVRAGSEWSPDSFKFTPNPQTNPPLPKQYLGRNSNFVMGSTLRLPIIINPIRSSYAKQPSQLTLAPVAGLEGGFRIVSHEICMVLPEQACMSQQEKILRQVLGGDASVRSPYNITRNFLGDRPITIDFSYRMRRLSYAEPFTNQQYAAHNAGYEPAEGQSLGKRSYTRITFIAPFSAYLQFRATWQHGALPPVFQFVGDQVTFGFTFSNPGSSEH
jgi:hypothetical protein